MGAIITRREYTNQFRPETTSWLIGNVGDRITLELDVEVEINFRSSFSNPIESDGTNQFVRSAGSFLEDGFKVGGAILWDVSTAGGPFSGTGTISMLTPEIMRVTVSTGTFPPSGDYPFNDGTIINSELLLLTTDTVESLILNYNLIANSDLSAFSLESLVDGTTPRFEAVGIDPTDTVTVVPLNPIGFESGTSVFNASIIGGGLSGLKQLFTITIDFQIMPLFDALSDFTTDTAPSFFFDDDSITDVFKLTFYPEYGNPNNYIETDPSETALEGNCGWFNENNNGLPNNYSVVGVNYTTDSGIALSGVSKDENTNFQIVIEQTGATATSDYVFGFFTVPSDKALIQENDKKSFENIILNDLGQTVNQGTAPFTNAGYSNTSGAQMDVRFDSITNSGSKVYINGQFQPNNDFGLYFNGIDSINWNYGVFVSLADETLATNLSDRVSLLCDFGTLATEVKTFVLGDINIEILNHVQGITNVGSSTYLGCVEDEVLTDSLMYLDTAKTESVDSITFVVEGFNTADGRTFNCETYSIDTTGFDVDADGVQLLNVNTVRGFQMAPDVDKNIVQVFRDATNDTGTKKAFWLRYALRPRWEYWVNNPNVPADLTESGKTFDGKNQNWARLDSFFNDWKLRFSIQTELNSDGSQLDTRNSANVYIKTYEESDVWDGSINHWDETRTTDLFVGLDADGIRQNIILDSEFTLIEADFDLEDVMGDVGSIADYFGVIRIEVFEQGGFKGIEMISTDLENTNRILKPVALETKCKIEKISLTKIRLSALIDSAFLDLAGPGYKTSARIGYKNLLMDGIYGPQYGPQYD